MGQPSEENFGSKRRLYSCKSGNKGKRKKKIKLEETKVLFENIDKTKVLVSFK